MRKPKIYLDTSVVSHLDAPDTPDKQADTRKLWEGIKAGEYEVFLSPVAMGELDDCAEPKRSFLNEQLQAIQFTELEKTDEVVELAERYLEAGILRPKSFDDAQHIAYACVYSYFVLK